MKKLMLLMFALIFLVIANATQAALTDDLIHYFTLDEKTGTLYENSILGNANLSTTGSPPSVIAKIDNGSQSSSTNYIRADTSEFTIDLDVDNFSICAWINFSDLTANAEVLCVGQDSGGKSVSCLTIGTPGGVCDANTVCYANSERGQSWYKAQVSTASLTEGQFEHYCMTYDVDATNDTLLYHEGVLVAQGNFGGTTVTEANGRVSTGWLTGAGPQTTVTIDELGLWKGKALTAGEISTLYNSGAGLTYPFVVAPVGNFSVSATDYFDGASLENFTVTMQNGTDTLNFSVTGFTELNTSVASTDAQLWNITVGSNQSGGYFNRTHITYNISDSGDLASVLHQAELLINPYELTTNTSIPAGNLTNSKETILVGNRMKLKVGVTEVTFSHGEYFNLSKNFTVAALSNGTQNMEDIYNAIINITAIDLINGGNIQNFSANISLGATFVDTENTTSGQVLFNAINGTYTIGLNSSNYVFGETTALINGTKTRNDIQFSLFTTNNINFTFIDEETDVLIDFTAVTVELISEDVFATNATTSNGNVYLDLITPSSYTIRTNAEGYETNFYMFTLSDRTTNAITIRMLNESSATTVTAQVLDEINNPVTNAVIKVLRYDIDTNSFNTVQISGVDFEAKTTLQLVLNDEFYKFIIESPSGTVRTTTQTQQVFATELTFQIQLTSTAGSQFFTNNGVNVNLSFNDATNNFLYVWSDSQNIATQACLEVFRVTGTGQTAYNDTCVSSSSGSLTVGVDNATGVTYVAKSYVYFDDTKQYMTSLWKSFILDNVTGSLGVFGLLIVFLVIVSVGYFNPTVAVLLAPLPFTLGVAAGLLEWSIAVPMGLHAVSIMLAFMMSKRS